MPSTNHQVFAQPANPDTKIWRYMNFTKFVSMLEHQALWFSRADKLGDPFEGSMPKTQHGYPHTSLVAAFSSYPNAECILETAVKISKAPHTR